MARAEPAAFSPPSEPRLSRVPAPRPEVDRGNARAPRTRSSSRLRRQRTLSARRRGAIGYLRTRGSGSAQLVNDRLYNDRLGIFESFESPAIKLKAQRALVVLERGLQHLQYTGFSSPPISMHPNVDRRFRGSPD